jgi:hypothetical protein
MSYDLFVFEAEGVPRDNAQFTDWFRVNREALEESETWLSKPATERLASFYNEMVERFPDMNGPSGEGIEEGDQLTGYEFQNDHIYMDFRWSVAEDAGIQVMNLAHKHGLGMYDLISVVIYPEDDLNAPATPPTKPSMLDRVRNLFRN